MADITMCETCYANEDDCGCLSSDSSVCSTTQFQTAATRLTEVLGEANLRFRSLKGKVACSVTDSKYVLGFQRHESDWSLMVGESVDELRPVTEASITAKVAAAGMIHQLIELTNERAREMTEAIELAIVKVKRALGS